MRGERYALALIEAASEAKEVGDYQRAAISILNQRVGFDVAIYRRLDGVGTHGLDPEIELACGPHWSQFRREIAPVFRAALAQRGVAVDVDVLGMQRIERLE